MNKPVSRNLLFVLFLLLWFLFSSGYNPYSVMKDIDLASTSPSFKNIDAEGSPSSGEKKEKLPGTHVSPDCRLKAFVFIPPVSNREAPIVLESEFPVLRC